VGIKILTVAFALFALRRVVVRWRKGHSMTFEFLFWTVLFAGIGVVVFVPKTMDAIAQWMGVSTGYNALMFITVLGLLFAVYRLIARTQTIERDITRLVRSEALRTAERVGSAAPPTPPSA
jgi:hypothetical protein